MPNALLKDPHCQPQQNAGSILKTAFRWRHRFLRYAVTTKATRLSGIIEADEVFTVNHSKVPAK